ncbi:MAG: lytic transglycosylase domain-containing protein [Phenylobacterium sp.]|jgi:soluble lytic murein transglycosylase-like protein|uniref:lytic transglycosylase domain-containing protein n=1 Tax=Phenylobacterium sp. TaxID=1871053 RepID=UPI002A361530|nr:lytic transglycosylase domain-containing protein [Phenylobacterium sp.]MDX9997096.1 lytic transglycosylase domain-containing protein [Phenylobacterium sp.]
MTKSRLRLAAVAFFCAVSLATTAAAGPQALSPWDVARYKAAFAAADRGDFIEAQLQAAEIKDKSLLGHLAFRKLMHPSHRASFQELSSWLDKHADLPGADRVYTLAMKRKPAGAPALKAPMLAGQDWARIETTARGLSGPANPDRAAAARQAFYSGDPRRALTLAQASGERWIAGLSAYRLKNYSLAETYFEKVARDESEDAWLRAAAGYWAARSATESGDAERAESYLRLAARHPHTFYGMIAERQTGLQTAAREQELSQAPRAATGDFVLASYTGGSDLTAFVKSNPRAHRAVALSQVGRTTEAGLELRAGLALAKGKAERDQWGVLLIALNAPLTSQADAPAPAGTMRPIYSQPIDYPTPVLEPKWGFTIDKALVYAIAYQESRFNPMAVSPAGAIGLMQLMPEAAARAAGDDKLKADMSPLFDPAFNLRVGQDYFTWLLERGVGYDLLRAVAAYNGGPGTLQKTAQMLGDEADSLLIIECLPSLETRNYVEKVVAAYWTYKKKFGEHPNTLDALAKGARFVDARLDFGLK